MFFIFSFFLIFLVFFFIFLEFSSFSSFFLMFLSFSSFLFSCISFKYVLLLALVSEFNCFLRSLRSMEMWCADDIGRDSWDWVGPPAWGRACFNSPEWGGGSSPVKTEPPQIVLLLLLCCCCGCFGDDSHRRDARHSHPCEDCASSLSCTVLSVHST